MERNDSVWMAEVAEEATHVACHKQRLAFFFSAMRHFRDDLRQRDISVHYHQLKARPDQDRGPDFATILTQDVKKLRPEKLVVVLPGDYRVRRSLEKTARKA